MDQQMPSAPMNTYVEPKRRVSVWKVVFYLILAALVVWIAYAIWRGYEQSKLYSVVYLRTGDIYVGKLSFFPKTILKDPYILSGTKDEKDPKKNSFKLSPLRESVWNTKRLTLNKDQIMFHGLLDKDSAAGKALMAGPQAQQQAPAQEVPPVQQVPAPQVK
ncbi:hypothetical protein HY620_00930 [Candidatus Uhrbacteria bacterium]|nr:hypothetical protein [Candidatus Uhrbacteria bacterium]